MKRISQIEHKCRFSPDMGKFVERAEGIIGRAITASNVFQTRLSHEKSVIGDEHITGYVGGARYRARRPQDERKGRAKKSIGVPISRKGRPVSSTGLVTFHLCITPVRAATIDAKTLAPAGHHDLYINREDALPKDPKEQAINSLKHGNYIERDSATAKVESKPVILSSISHDPIIRADFHAKMEQMERDCMRRIQGGIDQA